MSGDGVSIRHIADADWDAIAAMESRTYAELGLSEGRAALQSRAYASPDTSFVLDVGAQPAGYLLALPYPPFRYPSLDRVEEPAVPSRAGDPTMPLRTGRNLHLHDIVVAEPLRGTGLGQRLLNHLTLTAGSSGFERISLIAVGRSEPFWSARGFSAYPGISPGGYGASAVYMSKAMTESTK
ncbi:GNAT family N-acetyltransferase [Streptomyces olivochromogenes]|uniref:GNAT family N-acetyltransferase n=1 Tax=Streptomyces olivochromogenes TaxID=1963 RepID=UPI001F40A123|nr:GNAT family N-acetyltransferase [Streptomyces olivochromogenes]MCF3135049.1 GNAT family N-acetyltransferase [Streptomyces olivochromogenes]